MTRWPEAGVRLWSELERMPGRFALMCGPQADDVANDLADLRGAVPLHVGRCLTSSEARPSAATIRVRLGGHPVLTGTEVLLDAALSLDPVRLLAQLAKDHPPLLAVWPIYTGSDRLAYPPGVSPGRDTAQDLQGCLLLTSRTTIFGDEVPFTIERFS